MVRSRLRLIPVLLYWSLATATSQAQPLPTPMPSNSTPPTPGPASMPSAPGPASSSPALPSSAVSSPTPLPLPQGSASDATVGPIKFGEITIDAALEMLERWSGRSILRPAGLPATSLSFSLNQKVSREEACRVLESLLTLNGIAVTPLGDKYLKVTPLNAARTEAPDFIEGSTLGLPSSGHIASKLFQLKFLRASEFAPQIASLLNAAAASAPVLFEKSNAMLLTDSVSNLQRIETLLARVDQPSLEGLTPKFYRVHNSTASALVTKLQSLLSGAAGTQIGTGTTYQADDRTNQIILMSDARQQPLFDELIEKLDTAGESSTRQEVIPLKHANATEVATLLSSLISGSSAGNARAGANQANQQLAAARNAALAAATNAARQTAPNAPRPANQAPVVSLANPGSGGGNEASQQFSDILNVVADDRSNALVVSGTVEDLRLIKDIVTQLDVLLAQVRIEVVIAEITLTDAATTGIDSLGMVISGSKLVAFNAILPGMAVAGVPDGTGLATPYATLTRNPTGDVDLAATLRLTSTPRKSNVNILSVPNITTTHNKEAILFVGEKRPTISSYINNQTGGATVGAGYSSTITQTEIGITLKVKPLIGNDGSVQLEIDQKVDDVLDTVLIDGNAQPVIGSRTATSFVSAQSGDIIVLGGLQRKTQSRSTSRLGGIPFLGDLLGSRKREITRNDLVFFLRPYVLTNTAADNAEALRRLEASPQKPDVEAALTGVPLSIKR
jgi:general secretion pathway protein D